MACLMQAILFLLIVAELPATVSNLHFPSGRGDDPIIDKKSPTMNNPATNPDISISPTP
jgi:hypothetical protein